jgi:2-(3-amino-3-carboxypropyl)histidine synthase
MYLKKQIIKITIPATDNEHLTFSNYPLCMIIDEIKKTKAKKVLLQVPEGLRTKVIDMANDIRKQGIDVIISSDPCYGACDIPDKEAERLGCDLIVHVGHNKFYKDFTTKVPVLYFPWTLTYKINWKKFDTSKIKEERIGLVTSVQHLDMLTDFEKFLKKTKKVVVGGQILGCWTKNAEKIEKDVDAFLFIGTGMFHASALNKKTYVFDLEKQQITEAVPYEKKLYANIFKARNAKTYGIIVSSKLGQFDIKKAEEVKKVLEQRDKKAFILILDEITDGKLLGIRVDAFINTACPRIAEDKFSKPIINAKDIEKLFDGE